MQALAASGLQLELLLFYTLFLSLATFGLKRRGQQVMKIGDLVVVKKHGWRHPPDGSVGIIIKEVPLSGPSSNFHRCFTVQFQNGDIGKMTDFYLEVINESR